MELLQFKVHKEVLELFLEDLEKAEIALIRNKEFSAYDGLRDFILWLKQKKENAEVVDGDETKQN